MKVYLESPARTVIKSPQKVQYLENHLMGYVRKYGLPAEFKTDSITISTYTQKQKNNLWDALKSLKIAFAEKK